MAIYKRDIVDINLETGSIHRSFLNHTIGMKDKKADHFGIRVFRNGEPVNLAGASVQGLFMPPVGDPIAITSGNIISGNVAEVVLPAACYNVDGQFTLAIKLVDATDEITGTIRIVDGVVSNTDPSGAVAPTGAVPTYQEVLAAYDEAIDLMETSARFMEQLLDESDLDDLYKPGWYQLIGNGTYSNVPSDDDSIGQRVVWVFPCSSAPTSTKYRVMLYYNYRTGYFAVRYYYDQEWKGWQKVKNPYEFKYIELLTDGSDLDDLYKNGWYHTATSATYYHTPEAEGTTGQRVIMVFNCAGLPTDSTYRIMFYYNNRTGVSGFRYFYSSVWHEWHTSKEKQENTVNYSFTPAPMASQGDNEGVNLRVMSYNVAVYNNNTDVYLPDEKMLNFRKMLGIVNPDLIGCQEDRDKVNEDGTKTATEYLYLPAIASSIGTATGGNVVRAKKTPTSIGRVKYTQYGSHTRGICYAVYEYGDKTLLFGATHPTWNDAGDGGTSAANIAIRASQYEEMMKWLSGLITLPKYSDNSPVYCPEHTHAIICADANSVTDTDKTNLATLAETYDFVLGNGGKLGWFYTNLRDTPWRALDNIIVSDNVIINNIVALNEWYNDLYSDHIPLVADVTLL